jgi:hypothetical protein
MREVVDAAEVLAGVGGRVGDETSSLAEGVAVRIGGSAAQIGLYSA